MLPSILWLGLQLGLSSLVMCQDFAVDSKSCPLADGTYEGVGSAVERAVELAQRAADILRSPAEMRPEARAKIPLIIGFPPEAVDLHAPTVAALDRIAGLAWYGDAADDTWKKDRNQNDVQFHCNMDHFEAIPGGLKDHHGIVWKDMARLRYSRDSPNIQKFKDLSNSDMCAISFCDKTEKPPDQGRLSVVVFHPKFMSTIRANGFESLTPEFVAKCADERLRAALPKGVTQMDLVTLSLLEVTVLHELLHTHLGLPNHGEPPGGEFNDWKDIIQKPTDQNAKSIAKLAVALVMVEDYGFDVMEDGTVKKL